MADARLQAALRRGKLRLRRYASTAAEVLLALSAQKILNGTGKGLGLIQIGTHVARDAASSTQYLKPGIDAACSSRMAGTIDAVLVRRPETAPAASQSYIDS